MARLTAAGNYFVVAGRNAYPATATGSGLPLTNGVYALKAGVAAFLRYHGYAVTPTTFTPANKVAGYYGVNFYANFPPPSAPIPYVAGTPNAPVGPRGYNSYIAV